MKVRVTREDIKNGVRGSATACPIALAVNRQMGWDCCRVGKTLRHTPANDFISMFDQGLTVRPQTFDFPDLDTSPSGYVMALDPFALVGGR